MAQAKKVGKEQRKSAPELQAFVEARKRPAVFLFIQESLDLPHVVRLRDALSDQMFEELDLVINSGGGSIHAAYQIVELLRLPTEVAAS